MGKGLSYLKKWGIGVNYCWNYGPSKLLLHFIEYRLDQLNSKHTKIAVNSAIQYFEGCSQKKCLLKVWRFLVHSQRSVKLNGIERKRSFKGQYFQTSRISDIWFNENSKFICSKSDLPIKCSVCEKVWFTINVPPNMILFNFFFSL